MSFADFVDNGYDGSVITMPTTIVHRDWKVLLDSLKRGTCAVLVGQGLPVSDTDGTPRNLANALSRKLAEALETEHGLVVEDRDNLPLVAEFFLDRNSRADLEVEVREYYTQALRELPSNGVTDPTFDSLASLPFPLFVSSRHDLILEHYLQPRRPVVTGYRLQGDVQTTLGEDRVGTHQRPLVYRLLGSISEPESLILTESDLLNLLRSIACDDPPLPKDLTYEFGRKNFLFIGCGLHTYYTRVLLHLLKVTRSRQRSFAFDSIPVNEDRDTFHGDYRRSVWFYEVAYKTLKVIDSDEHEFVNELRRRWEQEPAAGGLPVAPATTIASRSMGRPEVFLSYLREDEGDAKRLMKALERHGIDMWYDEFRIKAGDRWPDKIADAILNEVDFFMVLLSEHLDERDTYVHREIRLALDRRSMRGALKFIYPVSFSEKAHRLRALDREKIHAQHLADMNTAVANLAEDILEQFEKL